MADLFGVAKPVIAMAHFPALPGTPRHVRGTTIEQVADHVRRDIDHLLSGGVDGVLFCNEDDRPYSLHVEPEIPATMASVIASVQPVDRPFGVDILWDAHATMALAKATGAGFMREVVTGAYESDMGIWSPDAADLLRYRRLLDADDVLVLGNITPEFASPLGSRTVAERAISAVTSSLLDAILIAGPMAGAEPDLSDLAEAKDAIGDRVPVLMNTGARVDNVARFLEIADGVIVGSALKVDGHTWNRVDPERVRGFMYAVREARRS